MNTNEQGNAAGREAAHTAILECFTKADYNAGWVAGVQGAFREARRDANGNTELIDLLDQAEIDLLNA